MPHNFGCDVAAVMEAMMSAKEDAKLTGKMHGIRITSGQFVCKKCLGTIRYSIATNGHTRGNCSTPNCIAWIE